jgi:hypothetical protein
VRLKVLDAQVMLGVRGLALAFDQKSDLNQLIVDAPTDFRSVISLPMRPKPSPSGAHALWRPMPMPVLNSFHSKYGAWVPGRAKSIAAESLEETKIWRVKDVKRASPAVVSLSS